MIKGSDIEFRLIQNDEDEVLFQSLKDWPADRVGPITRRRAQEVLDQAMKQHENVEIPLTDNSDFFITFVIVRQPQGDIVGTTQGRIKNRSAYISWISFLPSMRGLGLFKESHFCWSELAFNLMGCDRMIVVTKPTIIPVTQLFDRYTGSKEEPRIGRFDTDDPKEKWVHTKAEYLADFAREDGYKNKAGQKFSFTVDQAKIPQKRVKLPRFDGRPVYEVDPANRQKPDVVDPRFYEINGTPKVVSTGPEVINSPEIATELPFDPETEIRMADGSRKRVPKPK